MDIVTYRFKIWMYAFVLALVLSKGLQWILSYWMESRAIWFQGLFVALTILFYVLWNKNDNLLKGNDNG